MGEGMQLRGCLQGPPRDGGCDLVHRMRGCLQGKGLTPLPWTTEERRFFSVKRRLMQFSLCMKYSIIYCVTGRREKKGLSDSV